jgi:hypothetical protein
LYFWLDWWELGASTALGLDGRQRRFVTEHREPATHLLCGTGAANSARCCIRVSVDAVYFCTADARRSIFDSVPPSWEAKK